MGTTGKGGGSYNTNPKTLADLSQFLRRTGLTGINNYLGNQAYGQQEDGTFNNYGRTAEGGFNFGNVNGTAVMGFDKRGRFFDNTAGSLGGESENAPVLDRMNPQVMNMFQQQWYTDLFNQVNSPEAPPLTGGEGGGGSGGGGYNPQAWLQEQERIAGEEDRDRLYSSYLEASTAATDYVTKQIQNERSNAAIMGMKYVDTPERTNERIRRYFTDIWDPKNDENLRGLIDKWGAPKDFPGFTLERLPEEEYDPGTTTQQETNRRNIEDATRRQQSQAPARTTRTTVTGNIPALGETENLLGV